MTFLHSFLFASSFFLATASNPAQAASNPGDGISTEVTSEAARETLTQVIREGISFPAFANEPTQEVIVRIKFQVEDQNRIDFLGVSGNDRRVVSYVEENLQGKIAGEQPIVPGVTFVSTLRFVR